MSFSGDLEHLPIVDVVQLLHATRKSGILRVTCRKGESQLVFKSGYIVSANHLNSSVRIGKMLTDLNFITQEVLDQALQEQSTAGADRKPLIVTLIENGHLREEDGYKGLERLIGMTIVEILTWKRGMFTLDVLPAATSDQYRFYPDAINREINIDTQSMLMEALRIYDEKMRDGDLTEELPEEVAANEESFLSADDLGLGDLDQLERKIPQVFRSLVEVDPKKAHRDGLKLWLPTLAPLEQEELVSFLHECTCEANDVGHAVPATARCLILFSCDDFLRHAVTTLCTAAGIGVLTTNEDENLAPLIERTLASKSVPVLLIDQAGTDVAFSSQNLSLLRLRMHETRPELPVIQLAAAQERKLTLLAYDQWAAAVFPSPLGEEGVAAAEVIEFLKSLRSFLPRLYRTPAAPSLESLKQSCSQMRDVKDPQKVARALLEGVARIFERTVILIVRRAELVAESSIGVVAGSGREAVALPALRIPLTTGSIPSSVVENGQIYLGPIDYAISTHVFAALGAPMHATILMLPLRNSGRTVAVAYADFGSRDVAPVDTALLDILAGQAELALEFALYRRKHEGINSAT